jgi:IS5 family transposase
MLSVTAAGCRCTWTSPPRTSTTTGCSRTWSTGSTAIRQPVGRPRKRPAKLHGDKGYDYPECRELLRARNIVPRIARKGIESSKRLGRHRYVIERCLEWTTRFRRLVRRYDREASHYLGFLRLACALICYRRADRLNLLASNNPN